jgi:glycosyltransferase domain-containing protein
MNKNRISRIMGTEKLDITFIMPTLNRTVFVERSLNYLNMIGANFIVVDGSPKNYRHELNLPNERYISAPGEPYVERVILGILESKTEYFMILPDDDYVDIESIKKIMSVMSKSPHVNSATGYFLDLWYSAKKDILYFRPVGIKYVEKFKSYDSVKDRIVQYTDRNYCFLYSVVKTRPIKDYLANNRIPLWVNDYYTSAEDYLTFLFLSLGNNLLMPVPHLYRSSTPTSTSRTENGKEVNKPSKQDYVNFFESMKNTNIHADDLVIMLNAITVRYRANIWRNTIPNTSLLKRFLPKKWKMLLSNLSVYYYSINDYMIFKRLILKNSHGKALRETTDLINKSAHFYGDSFWREKRPKYLYFKL